MIKQELVAYMTGLLAIMESKEATGLAKGQTLTKEYDLHYEKLVKLLQEEHRNDRRD